MEPSTELTGVARRDRDRDMTLTPETGGSEMGGSRLARPLALDLNSLELTDRQLIKISADNDNLRFELTAKGELVIMPPTGDPGGWKENELAFQVTLWTKQSGTGIAFGAAAGFRLPNGAVRAPDVSWVLREKWEAWQASQLERDADDADNEARNSFPNICPDFVLELRSGSDVLSDLQRKLEEYMENGARLGWLIDPIDQRVHIYRPGEPVEALENPATVSGETVLPGFELDLREIW